jgi:hypothetical protein
MVVWSMVSALAVAILGGPNAGDAQSDQANYLINKLTSHRRPSVTWDDQNVWHLPAQ